MDFGSLPPEITSARMYSGPGAGPMLAAAAAWDALAADLQSTAASYGSLISGLTSGSWAGPSSASMVAAAAPYVEWMSTAAAQAKEAAAQARVAVSAYEAAFAATVPPPVIAANRSQLASLLATNVFGQNLPAIAATEAQYAEMWAQDAAVMYGYAGSSAAATQMTPFSAPPQTTNVAGLASQSAAVAQATGASSGTGTQSILSGIPQILQQLASASTQYNAAMGNLLNAMTGNSSTGSMYSSMFSVAASLTKGSTIANDSMSVPNMGMVQFKTFFKPPVNLPEIPKSSLGAGLGNVRSLASTSAARAVSAGVGAASTVGALSVPPTWAPATPAIRLAANVLPGSGLAAAPAVDIPGSLLGQMAAGSMAGGALGASAPRVVAGTGIRGRAASGKDANAPVKLDRVIAQLQQRPDAVQHWQVDEAGLDGLLAELSKKPGIHAVHLSADGQVQAAPPTTKSR
ncbi:PPE family protein [Mycobacterium xenopi]|uniref:PPE family protein PPE33 n=1 Tax=Mycobacterium xenopi TaxID=1789 RepID=A0AAD1M1U2_MYCXE|nr:PPE family protein [Mycobacterium xenopi]MDA3640134.1 PPE family protein [Mycobacterium xenopi]MDA3658553.1 PPE family protein [Mycobacterium xenopi]ORX19529.1 hypothetical protein AWC32_10620 [Mycobacterium xenopi]SPX92784.1 PPE family protein [Mycobacterium xenopi]BBU22810.1 putative PPE family protein PPE33 [Mycobacterium xenopi]